MCRKERETSESAPACVAATNQVEQPADRDGEASGKRRGMEMSGGRGEVRGATRCGPELMTGERRGEQTKRRRHTHGDRGIEGGVKGLVCLAGKCKDTKAAVFCCGCFKGGKQTLASVEFVLCSTHVPF